METKELIACLVDCYKKFKSGQTDLTCDNFKEYEKQLAHDLLKLIAPDNQRKLLDEKISLFLFGGKTKFLNWVYTILENEFVNMSKEKRFKYEAFLIHNGWFPYRKEIIDYWHNVVKRNHPDIGKW